MTTSTYSTNNTNYDIITKSLIFKNLNPPNYTIHRFNGNSYLGRVFSKAIILRFNVQGKGTIIQSFMYDINNKVVKYKYSYYSEEQRIKDKEKTKNKNHSKEKKVKNRHENKI